MSTAVSLPPFFTLRGCHMLYRLHPSHNSSVIGIIYLCRVKAPRYVCILLTFNSVWLPLFEHGHRFAPGLPTRMCLQQHLALCTTLLELTKLRVTHHHMGSQRTHTGKSSAAMFCSVYQISRLCSGRLQVFIRNDGKQFCLSSDIKDRSATVGKPILEK